MVVFLIIIIENNYQYREFFYCVVLYGKYLTINTYCVVMILSPFILFGKTWYVPFSDAMHNLKKETKESVTLNNLM